MSRTCTILLLVALWLVTPWDCLAADQGSKLIPVTPAYSEPSPAPQPQIAPDDPEGYQPPRPRDQLYVFWILGRLINYPIDKVESFVSGKLESWKQRPFLAPASAPAGPNPFESNRWRQVPPAAPASASDH